MSGKYNRPHPDRGRSHYSERLTKRGLSKAPRMEAVDVLRTRQERRIEQFGQPWPTRVEAEAA